MYSAKPKKINNGSTLFQDLPADPDAILEVMLTIQEAHGGLTKDDVIAVASHLNIPTGHAFGVATFYSLLNLDPEEKVSARICDGPVCTLAGGVDAYRAVVKALSSSRAVTRNSCLGLCDHAPAALFGENQYGPLDPRSIPTAAQAAGWKPNLYTEPLPGEVRVMLAKAGKIDPTSLESALSEGGYRGLEKALTGPAEAILTEVEGAGIRGRGGAGFPTGRKWRLVADHPRTPKYIICNADESEPLVFKDRVLMDNDPHQILEGMAIAALAVGAEEGYIYIRGEYESQARLLEQAIKEATSRGYLGNSILGSDRRFHIHVHRGAGAYICGEETALLESMEGRRGEPRIRPPYPSEAGYLGFPTIVNNVETFATIPAILENGAAWYTAIGFGQQPGTKLYTLTGHIHHPGLFEAPFGITLREVIEEFGGGMKAGAEFHFALTGGAAGTIVPGSLLDVPLSFDSPEISLGAGAFLVCDESVSPLSVLRDVMFFFEAESCGKCTPCRIGTRLARQILDGFLAGEAGPKDLEKLQDLATALRKDSFCGLGQFAALPIQSTLTHFPQEFL